MVTRVVVSGAGERLLESLLTRHCPSQYCALLASGILAAAAAATGSCLPNRSLKLMRVPHLAKKMEPPPLNLNNDPAPTLNLKSRR